MQSCALLLTAFGGVACDDSSPAEAGENQVASAPAELKTEKSEKRDEPSSKADWCAGHQVPESMCAKCNSSLEAKFKAAGDWCAEHGHAESVCPLCHPQEPPQGASDQGDWCVEHALPESQCTKCNPSLVKGYESSGDWCAGHGFPESVCPLCNPQEPPPGAEKVAMEARTVRLRSAEIEKASGITTVAARKLSREPVVRCAARIEFVADKVADVRSTTPGIVRRLHVQLGTQVKKGSPLFELESADVGEIQGALSIAQEEQRIAELNLSRHQKLLADGVTTQREVELAEQSLAVAKAKATSASAQLRIAGAPRSGAMGRYTLYSPIAGTVVRRPAGLGSLATEDTSLATIGDPSVMWASCEVREADAFRVSLGQKTRLFLSDGQAGSFEGKLTWISAEVDPKTRTVTTRAEIENPEGRLRANQFAEAEIQSGIAKSAIAVPNAALQRIGDLFVLFVRVGEGHYEPRVVEVIGKRGQEALVEGRLKVGDAVVTTGAVLLRTEVVPGSIGAGCCEVDEPGHK